MMGVNGLYSAIGVWYGIYLNNVMIVRNDRCVSVDESIGICEQVLRECCEADMALQCYIRRKVTHHY